MMQRRSMSVRHALLVFSCRSIRSDADEFSVLEDLIVREARFGHARLRLVERAETKAVRRNLFFDDLAVPLTQSQGGHADAFPRSALSPLRPIGQHAVAGTRLDARRRCVMVVDGMEVQEARTSDTAQLQTRVVGGRGVATVLGFESRRRRVNSAAVMTEAGGRCCRAQQVFVVVDSGAADVSDGDANSARSSLQITRPFRSCPSVAGFGGARFDVFEVSWTRPTGCAGWCRDDPVSRHVELHSAAEAV